MHQRFPSVDGEGFSTELDMGLRPTHWDENSRVLPLPRPEEAMKMAGIDVHKKVLMVVVIETTSPEEKPERRSATTSQSPQHI